MSLRRHICTKGEERARACMDNLPPLRIRRLRNYVCRLKGARRSWERGCLAEKAWRSIRAASLFMAIHFGTPAMNPRLEHPDEVVGQVLHSTIVHYEQVLKDEEKKLREEARQRFRQSLHANGGVNRRMAQTIKEASKHELIIKDGERLVYDYKEMIEVLQAAWGEYWNKPSAPSTPEWEHQHLRPPQPTVHLQPITGALIREQLKQASRSSPGPDSWRFEEISALPEIAHEQLAELFGFIEEAEQFPKVMMSSWVAMISDKKGPLPPLKMRAHQRTQLIVPTLRKVSADTLTTMVESAAA